MKFIYLVIILIVSSCCTKMECNFIFNFKFNGFTKDDLSKISIVKIENNKIDTLNFYYRDSTVNLYNYLPKYETEYIIKVEKLNKEYKISNFQYKQESCNKCVRKSDNYDVLNSYTINGKHQYAESILIQK